MNDSYLVTPVSARPGLAEHWPATWRRVFPGHASQVSEARRFLTGCLAGRACAGDALVCLSELAANAVIHSNSRLPGGGVKLDFTEAAIAWPALHIDAEVGSGRLTLITRPGIAVDLDDVTMRSGGVKVKAPWDPISRSRCGSR